MKKSFSVITAVIVIVVLTVVGLTMWKNSEKNLTGKEDLIRVEAPKANAVIKNPLVVRGEARGYWYFEASFPVRLYDGDGREIAVGIAQAQGDWMTTEFVPFEGKLIFSTPDPSTSSGQTGTLVFQKDNPSGLPEHDDELRIPVRFF
ncbi:MAG: hypothetical protein A3G05_01920 [Candidatus Zambryskibacteria bacterium RIFCSPLOWO2_12_FULL_45_14]|uniref:Bacterial spore germination immunoglobulin-like domain-containing protein n=2 Tax=Candidatus Zambryskiibacteriota TaxID=1817925 RepID=A0A1G2UXL3_9BACT|nr:MAG: hypothetical protein A3G05_01920 [Candidatus Zambryskibacteria bacterium RIFCSPLOWO2_12_FULL_45_14]